MHKMVISLLVCAGLLVSACGSDTVQARDNVVMNTQSVEDVVASEVSQNDVTGDDSVSVDAQAVDANDSGTSIVGDENAVSSLIGKDIGASTAKVLPESTYKDVDLDLTEMSSTLIYSEVYNMMRDADPYMDKVIKMNGYVTVFDDPVTGNRYYSCIVPDATACCAQGIEFSLRDDFAKYDDYPVDGESITVVGVFSTYLEDGYQYCELKDAELVES